MKKIEHESEDLIDLGDVTSETKGGQPKDAPDGTISQKVFQLGISAD